MADENLQERITQLEQELSQSQTHEKTLSDLLEKKLNEISISPGPSVLTWTSRRCSSGNRHH